MSLFRSALRPPAPLSDEAVERYVAAIRAGIQPDPLFRRRLRGHVLNRHVAAHEGIGPRRAASEMGRVGRAVLYASFALSLSVTGAMAASQHAIPGDLIYPVKLQIEQLRLRALPEDLHDELAGYMLAERIAELDRLADAGAWSEVAQHAVAVRAAYDEVLAQDGGSSEAVTDGLEAAGVLLDRLPEQARSAVEGVLADLPGVNPGDHAGAPGAGRDHGGEPPGHSQGNGPANPGGSDASSATPKPKPTTPPQAEPTKPPQGEPTKPPQGRPSQSPKPMPTKPPQPSDPTEPPQAQTNAPNPGNGGRPPSTPAP